MTRATTTALARAEAEAAEGVEAEGKICQEGIQALSRLVRRNAPNKRDAEQYNNYREAAANAFVKMIHRDLTYCL